MYKFTRFAAKMVMCFLSSRSLVSYTFLDVNTSVLYPSTSSQRKTNYTDKIHIHIDITFTYFYEGQPISHCPLLSSKLKFCGSLSCLLQQNVPTHSLNHTFRITITYKLVHQIYDQFLNYSCQYFSYTINLFIVLLDGISVLLQIDNYST